MRYYIDFDNTLFDTERFYTDLLSIVDEFKITKEIIKKTSILKFPNELMNPVKILKFLIDESNIINKEDIINRISLFTDNLNSYLYNDVLTFLDCINKPENELILLTYGNHVYQQIKIDASGIKSFFDKIIITEKPKYDLDIDYTNGLFIDDNPVDLNGLINKNAKVIRIRRSGNKHSVFDMNNIKEYSSFDELINS